ncbi:MAG: transcriptional regulator PpsR [Geminicoccaceae bacterium]
MPRSAGRDPQARHFRAPRETLGDLDASAAATVIAAAADLALIVDPSGVIRDLACGSAELMAEWAAKWLGKPWIETVTTESRPKIESMLADAAAHADPRWRHVNHLSARGPDLPILYSTVQAGSACNIVAIGRDLRAMAGLQQRLIAAQQSMERDYARLRHVETRYRLLFQVTAEAVVIIDAGSHKVAEANPAAGQLLGETVKRMVGHPFLDSFDPAAVADVRTLLNGVQSTGRADNVRARLAESRRELLVYASLFRQENSSLFLVRLLPLSGDPNSVAVAKAKSRLLEVVESAPDGIVVTGPDGRILTANAAFLDLAQLATEEQARGESLERWLGRPGVDLNVLIANLRQHGSVRLFATTLRGEYGASSEIEVSAVSLPNGEQPCFGFTIRGVGRRLPPESRLGSELPRSVEQLTELVGRVPLKDLVRETTDVIERLCIEAALELTRDNRASAAEILGLSRQSLYVKLRRYGLGDLGSDGGDPG